MTDKLIDPPWDAECLEHARSSLLKLIQAAPSEPKDVRGAWLEMALDELERHMEQTKSSGMTTEKIRQAFAACRAWIPASLVAKRHSDQPLEHLVFMCEEGASYAEARREKAMRWLGFVQGALWSRGVKIETLKDMNRPDAAEPTEQATHETSGQPHPSNNATPKAASGRSETEKHTSRSVGPEEAGVLPPSDVSSSREEDDRYEVKLATIGQVHSRVEKLFREGRMTLDNIRTELILMRTEPPKPRTANPKTDDTCAICGVETCAAAGNPMVWPIALHVPGDATGTSRPHCLRCVHERVYRMADTPFGLQHMQLRVGPPQANVSLPRDPDNQECANCHSLVVPDEGFEHVINPDGLIVECRRAQQLATPPTSPDLGIVSLESRIRAVAMQLQEIAENAPQNLIDFRSRVVLLLNKGLELMKEPMVNAVPHETPEMLRVIGAAANVVNGCIPAVSAELEGSEWKHSRVSDSLLDKLRESLNAYDGFESRRAEQATVCICGPEDICSVCRETKRQQASPPGPPWPVSNVSAEMLGPFRVLTYGEERGWIVHGVDFDLVSQGPTLDEAKRRFWKHVAGQILSELQLQLTPLGSCNSVPSWVKSRFALAQMTDEQAAELYEGLCETFLGRPPGSEE